MLEKLILINTQTQETLFHTRSILNEDGTVEGEGAVGVDGEAAADVIEEEGVEIPDFLAGDGVEVYE